MIILKILSTPGCASCQVTKDLIDRIKDDYSFLQVEEIDLLQNPELAAKYGIMSSPGIVLDERLLFSGKVDEKELRIVIEKAGEE